MLLGQFINFIIFWLIVNIDSFVLPFQNDKTGAWTMDNFRYLFTVIKAPNSPILLNLKNTVLSYIVNMFAGYAVGLVFAFFLHRKILGHRGLACGEAYFAS